MVIELTDDEVDVIVMALAAMSVMMREEDYGQTPTKALLERLLAHQEVTRGIKAKAHTT